GAIWNPSTLPPASPPSSSLVLSGASAACIPRCAPSNSVTGGVAPCFLPTIGNLSSARIPAFQTPLSLAHFPDTAWRSPSISAPGRRKLFWVVNNSLLGEEGFIPIASRRWRAKAQAVAFFRIGVHHEYAKFFCNSEVIKCAKP